MAAGVATAAIQVAVGKPRVRIVTASLDRQACPQRRQQSQALSRCTTTVDVTPKCFSAPMRIGGGRDEWMRDENGKVMRRADGQPRRKPGRKKTGKRTGGP